MIRTERADEQVEHAEVVPQAPGGAGTPGGDRFELPPDSREAGRGSPELLDGGETQRAAVLDRPDHRGVDRARAVGLIGVMVDDRQRWGDRQGSLVDG